MLQIYRSTRTLHHFKCHIPPRCAAICYSSQFMNQKTEKQQLETASTKPDPKTQPMKVDQDGGSREISAYQRKNLPLLKWPLVKYLFVGRLNHQMLEFPELDTSEAVTALEQMCAPVEALMQSAGRENLSVAEVLDPLRRLGVLGNSVPVHYGGMGLSHMQSARFMETLGGDLSTALSVFAHLDWTTKAILTFGSLEQKQKYLPMLASGEYVGAFAAHEPCSGNDVQLIRSRCVKSVGGDHYILSGTKTWVTNGAFANLFVVVARTDDVGKSDHGNLSAFIVERNFGGVTTIDPLDTLGMSGSGICSVNFNECRIPAENRLGLFGDGYRVVMRTQNESRATLGLLAASHMRHLLSHVVPHCLKRKRFGHALSDSSLVRNSLSHIAQDIYATESMGYMVAGFRDAFESPDMSLEAACLKVFASEAAFNAVSECKTLIGCEAYSDKLPLANSLGDTRALHFIAGTNEITRLFIANMGVQYVASTYTTEAQRYEGGNFRALIRFLTNPNAADRAAIIYRLDRLVHPTLVPIAGEMGVRILKFRDMVKANMKTHKTDLQHEQVVLSRFADIAIDLFAMICSISRASRSLSIGLHHSDQEMELACTFCLRALRRVDENFHWVSRSGGFSLDTIHLRVAGTMLLDGGYGVKHPLTRNW